MGIYLHNMEMPRKGEMLVIFPDGTSYVCFNGKRERLAQTEAFQVPPHGRLIDADALIEDLERQCKEVFRIDAVSPDDYWITRNEAYNEALWKSWVESFGEYLKTRPTIIEAEV